ncbi:hypothetical protein BDB00DRAFT_983142 [Zychaea mexicana]|uniref:uncharacterized protein n=1 Tax=Zychaea mexicana TaxID=64656 RepID=UPI0022FDEC9D|nr:uncharacterized protein BDB00DRAFT_983142 [Zychaea mexicana]KAI9487965.1 hypothetical protein BDB00DRAFT_983142 [Zychaea mexicana]
MMPTHRHHLLPTCIIPLCTFRLYQIKKTPPFILVAGIITTIIKKEPISIFLFGCFLLLYHVNKRSKCLGHISS